MHVFMDRIGELWIVTATPSKLDYETIHVVARHEGREIRTIVIESGILGSLVLSMEQALKMHWLGSL